MSRGPFKLVRADAAMPGRVVIETERLAIRELAGDDLDFVAEMLAHPEVMHCYPRPYRRDEAAGWIWDQARRYERYGYGFWLAVDRASNRPIGQVGLTQPRVEGVPEDDLGYLIHRPHWGRGYATEGAVGVRRHAFEVLGRSRLVCLIRPGNRASIVVAERSGFAIEPGRQARLAGHLHEVYAAEAPPGPPDVVGSVAEAPTR